MLGVVEKLYDDDATTDERIEAYQSLINSGDAWRLDGHVGRTAMGLIERGLCALGHEGHRDYWGNYVPSRSEVEQGTKGSAEFVVANGGTVLDPEVGNYMEGAKDA